MTFTHDTSVDIYYGAKHHQTFFETNQVGFVYNLREKGRSWASAMDT